jgi:hypothetical protein
MYREIHSDETCRCRVSAVYAENYIYPSQLYGLFNSVRLVTPCINFTSLTLKSETGGLADQYAWDVRYPRVRSQVRTGKRDFGRDGRRNVYLPHSPWFVSRTPLVARDSLNPTDQIRNGTVNIKFLDETVKAMLRTKFTMGLFESRCPIVQASSMKF